MRDVQGRRAARGVRRPRSSAAGVVIIVTAVRADARTAGLRAQRQAPRGGLARRRVSDHAEGPRRRLPARSPSPLAALGAAARDHARARRDHPRLSRILRQPRLHPDRRAHLHAERLRGYDHALRDRLLRHQSLPDAERAALRRGDRDGPRPRLLLRPDLPRREIQDAPSSDGVLDGGGRLHGSRRRHGSRQDFNRVPVRVLANRRAELVSLERALEPLERTRKPFLVSATAMPSICSSRRASRCAGATTGADEETVLSNAFDRPVLVHRYPSPAKRST